MKPSTARAVDRLMNRVTRPPRRPRGRFSVAPIYLGLGLFIGFMLLTRLVPMVWSSQLPGGLDQADRLVGWPGLIWGLALRCHYQAREVVIGLAGVFACSVVVMARLRPLRLLVWLAVVAVVMADAAIVYITLKTSVEAMAAGLNG